MKKLMILMTLMMLVKSNQICNLADHMKYKFTECEDPGYTTAFFYYDNDDRCNTAPGRSEALPPPLGYIPCHNLCPEDGMYSTIEVNFRTKEPELECV